MNFLLGDKTELLVAGSAKYGHLYEKGGVCILVFLDDRALIANSREQAAAQLSLVLSHIQALGFSVNLQSFNLSMLDLISVAVCVTSPPEEADNNPFLHVGSPPCQGSPIGRVSFHKVVSTDASWVALCDGVAVRGVWIQASHEPL